MRKAHETMKDHDIEAFDHYVAALSKWKEEDSATHLLFLLGAVNYYAKIAIAELNK